MSDSWTCIMVEDGPGLLPEEVRAALKFEACKLHRDRFDSGMMSNDVCTGYIETMWDTHTVGSRTGVLFKTQLTCEEGDYWVNFLLHENDLVRGAEIIDSLKDESIWLPGPPVPVEGLTRFLDLGSTTIN